MTSMLTQIWSKASTATALVVAALLMTPVRPAYAASGPGLTVRVRANQKAYAPGEHMQFTVIAHNATRRAITLRFPSAQTFDLTITPHFTPNPRVRIGPPMPVWQWSHNRMFAQAVTRITLAPGAKKMWYAGWNQTNNDGWPVPSGRCVARAWLPAGRRYESPPLMFRIAAQSASTPVDIRGTVTELRMADSNWRQDELGAILVEGRKESDTQVDRASVTVTTSTRVWRQSSGGRIRVAFSDLKEGDRIGVRFNGAVRESYPVGATAGDIMILPKEKNP